ncbi:MAG: thiamine-phosphate kinase [Cyanobacteria bacterium P01_A01_bin.84]
MKIADIGEQGLLKILHRFCASEIIGDDAALLTTTPEQSLVVTTDVLIDGVHFSNQTTSAEDAGWRAVAANLSDLAAMGASPLGITVGLGLPKDTCVSWVEDLYRGMSKCLSKYDAQIVGGDLVRSPVISINISAFGEVKSSEAIFRNQASEGDAIIVTGVHGASAAGLKLLLNPNLQKNLSSQECQELIKAHQRPQPRLDILPVLRKTIKEYIRDSGISPLRLAEDVSPTIGNGRRSPAVGNRAFVISGMDSSDGLADALLQICRASGVGAVVKQSKISLPKSMIKLLGEQEALNYALYGGEDFELVLCLSPFIANNFIKNLHSNATIIGNITSNSQVILQDDTGIFSEKILSLEEGFKHF